MNWIWIVIFIGHHYKVHGYSHGAGNCHLAKSYFHGPLTPGHGNFSLNIEKQANSKDAVSVEIYGLRPFKGFLLYTDVGAFVSLPQEAQYKAVCDSERGVHRTLTHIDATPKKALTFKLTIPVQATDLRMSVIIMEELRQWYWLNATFDGTSWAHSYL